MPQLEELTKELIHRKLQSVPNEHRNKLIKLIQGSQRKMASKSYSSKENDLLSLTIGSDGLIKDISVKDTLFKLVSSKNEFNKLIKESVCSAHKEIIEAMRKDLTDEAQALNSKLNTTINEIKNTTN